MSKYKVLKSVGTLNVDEVVDEVALDVEMIQGLIDDGSIELVPEDTTTLPVDTTTPPADVVPPVDTTTPPVTPGNSGEEVEKTLTFNGKVVVSKTVRVIEDKEVH